MDVPRMHQGSCISIFRSLPTWKVLHLLCVSRASSWSLCGPWWHLRGFFLDIMNVPSIYMKESAYSFSDLYKPGKCSNSWLLQSIIQVSSLESKRMLVVPESLGGFWHNGCPKPTSRKLHINFKIIILLESGTALMCLQSFIMESKRMLVVPERSFFFLTEWMP